MTADHITQPYTLAELRAKIASHDYSAELLLQHAMLLLERGHELQAQSSTVGAEPVAGWYFSEQQPSGTMLAVEPGGERHVIKNGRMDSAAGRRLLGAMTRALCAASPLAPATLSWSGFNVHGDDASIRAVRDALHDAGTVPELKARIREAQPAAQVVDFPDAHALAILWNKAEAAWNAQTGAYPEPWEHFAELLRAALAQAPAAEPLTDEQIDALADPFVREIGGGMWHTGDAGIKDDGDLHAFARAIERAHGIGADSHPQPKGTDKQSRDKFAAWYATFPNNAGKAGLTLMDAYCAGHDAAEDAPKTAVQSPAPGASEFHNPWRASLENCISGDNYLRASEYRELIEELDDLYRLRAAPRDTSVPAGMALVPTEPTQEMCQQGQWKAQEWPRFPLRIVPIWKAMLAAAPIVQRA